MGLVTRYNTQEEIPEEAREDFVEDTISEKYKGTWAHKDVIALEEGIRKERNDHKAAKTSLQQITEQLTGVKGELDSLHQIGTLEELQELRKKADAAAPPAKIEELRSQLTATTQQLREAQSWKAANEARLKQLEEAQAQYARETDQAKAKDTILATVKGLQGVNAEALSENLFMQYLAGRLVRSEAGEIVTKSDGIPVAEFAARYAKDHGLVLKSVGGGANPPAGVPHGSKATLQASYEAARKAGNVDEMLRLKSEIGKLS